MTSAPTDTSSFHMPFFVRWAGFSALCVGMFMAILDIQVVVTSLKTIEEALGIGADLMSWVQTSYIIAEVIAIPMTGLLLRVFSMRWLFVAALGIFTFASIGCALSSGFADLLAWRVLQGFAGGVLIPLVFSAIFLLFPRGPEQTMATLLGGLLAVLGPALGPVCGGWLTEHFSWHWLFLINVVPGIIATLVGGLTLPRPGLRIGLLRELDWLSLVALGLALSLLVIGLKEAPARGWFNLIVLGCFAGSALSLFISVTRPMPAIQFYLLKDRALAFGCALSFLLGLLLFSAVYLVPVFLGFVGGLGPLAIGLVTLTMGVTQIIVAPATVLIDKRFDARWLSAIGFTVFGCGLFLNGNLTALSSGEAFFVPQIIRGLSVALCILPPIRMALGMFPLDKVSDASGLFNLMRNMGGVIGIALMDTIIFSRTPMHGDRILALLKSAPAEAASLLGVPMESLPDPSDAMSMFSVIDFVEGASLTLAINECWHLLAGISFLALPILWWLGPIPSAAPVRKINS